MEIPNKKEIKFKMEIKLKDCTLTDALRELEYQRNLGYEAYFSGVGDGSVILEVQR